MCDPFQNNTLNNSNTIFFFTPMLRYLLKSTDFGTRLYSWNTGMNMYVVT